MRALVVDDCLTTRYALKVYLQGVGFQVYEAGNGQDALATLSTEGPMDLALVDWSMPVMNGLEFLTAVRADHKFDPMKMMMVTIENDLAHMKESLAAGATEYIMKPFTREILQSKLGILGF